MVNYFSEENMSNNKIKSEGLNIKSHRLSKKEIEDNFSDLHSPLTPIEALIEADRCYFCYDAPCTKACPSDIDVPGFIQSIRSDNLTGAAEKILSENIFGGMCARDCPTEDLCQQACVRNDHEEKPVEIGLLQRYATDSVLNNGVQLFSREENTGKSIAVVGAGPSPVPSSRAAAAATAAAIAPAERFPLDSFFAASSLPADFGSAGAELSWADKLVPIIGVTNAKRY